MKGITKESVNKEQQTQNFENRKYDPLENPENILFDNSSDPDLDFYNTIYLFYLFIFSLFNVDKIL